MEQEKVVLAFSGGLDTSIAIPFLKEKEGAEVITVTLDVGGPVNPELLREKSLKYGAIKHYAIDAKEEFAKNYVFQAIKANALYEGKYPVSSSLSRPLIAKYLVEIAKKEEANILAHACTGKGNDQVRFDVTIK
ncbi:MAG: argininosuccinate synthase domain-containing protein, partial [Asgard group archaeon]